MNRILVLESYVPKALFGDGPEQHTPEYPKFGVTVQRYRKMRKLTRADVVTYAEAIFSQLRTMQRAVLNRELTPIGVCSCASRSWETDGAGVLKAVRRQQRNALDGALAESWRLRSDEQVRLAYEATMRGEDPPLTLNIHVPGREKQRHW